MSENKTSPKPYGRATKVAATVIGMGLVASIAGNFQSIILEPGSPSVGAMISAVWWPALLFAMIELAIHTPWGQTALWRTVQWMGAGIIGGLAFYISYFHLAHVLSYFGYDIISRYAGPITVDVAMMVATLAMHRIGVAKRALASQVATEAEVATLASAGQTEMATEPVAKTEPVATAGQEPSLATDWADLEADFDRELAEMTTAARTAPEPVAAAEPAAETPDVSLTKVPAEAAKRIQEILAEDPSATGVAIADALVEAGLAGSIKTGRRWAGAVKNNTARVA